MARLLDEQQDGLLSWGLDEEPCDGLLGKEDDDHDE